MKPLILLPLFCVLLLASSCNDQCKETRVVRNFQQLRLSVDEVRNGIRSENPRSLESPGKIYVYKNYLLINELKKGVHVIDNSDISNPRMVSFLKIPGNGDMAVRDDILYADSYMDLVTLDLSNPTNPKEVGRNKDVFKSGVFDGGWWSVHGNAIEDQEVSYHVETIKTDCEDSQNGGGWWGGPMQFLGSFAAFSNKSGSSGGSSGSGTAGSMARFALYDRYLYTVDNQSLHLFDISAPQTPESTATVKLGWGIETIFPYRDKLFIGTTTGMQILDNSDPSAPKHLSTFNHARACDPVVVHENTAYVTLRTGNGCQGSENQLDVIDISSVTNPKLIKSYPMQNPYGLSINFPNLYLCEGTYGLKGFDASDNLQIASRQNFHLRDQDAYDVISLGNHLLLIGRDGFFQYDASNSQRPRLLSKIPVHSPIPQIKDR